MTTHHHGSHSNHPVTDSPQAGDGTVYTCPMHPEVRQVGPGNCPICGMALEPLQSAPSDAPSPELRDMTRRLCIGAALSAPLFVLEMGAHFPGLNLYHLVPPLLSQWIQFFLATPVVLWAGWPFFTRGWDSVRHRSLNMFSLIALGVGAAYLYSLAGTFLPGLFPADLRNSHGLIPVYFEAAAVITVLVLIGQVLELRAREHTGSAIRALLNLAPKTARRLRASAVSGLRAAAESTARRCGHVAEFRLGDRQCAATAQGATLSVGYD